MLVLSRKVNEWVVVSIPDRPDKIHICLTALKGDKARLGFDAAQDIIIHRAEVEERIARQGQDGD